MGLLFACPCRHCKQLAIDMDAEEGECRQRGVSASRMRGNCLVRLAMSDCGVSAPFAIGAVLANCVTGLGWQY